MILRGMRTCKELSEELPNSRSPSLHSNLLHDLNTYNQSNIHYFVRFFRGEFAKKSSYMLQVTFAGFKVVSMIY